MGGAPAASGFFGSNSTPESSAAADGHAAGLPHAGGARVAGRRQHLDQEHAARARIRRRTRRRWPGGPARDPFGEYFGPFERFFGPPQGRPHKQRSLGSGFVVDNHGFILTNNHVVENADEIMVKLSDGKELKAKVVGRDSKTDLALIEIDGAHGLTTCRSGTPTICAWVTGCSPSAIPSASTTP
jgi:S1-C subfamily serine protease